jgi:hypothetical protein
LDIITLSEKVLGIEDNDIEVEYQGETIGKYDLEFNGKDFMLLKQPPALPRINVESRKSKKRNSLKFQVKQTVVPMVVVN